MKTSFTKLNNQDSKCLEKFTPSRNIRSSSSSLLYLSASFGIASISWAVTSGTMATAQTPKTPVVTQTDVRSISQVSVLFVNPYSGDDASDGSESTPLKTITKAIQLAKDNTVIKLAQGNYTSESGEKFPIFLKPGVSIEGNLNDRGTGVIISGGGDFLSRTFGSKNVTIVGADNVKISGITVTNTNSRGYGLWIESSSPTVTNNNFIGSTQDGIIVTGQASPIISQNGFYRNQANGITIMGSSRAQVEENTFQYTGYAINIAQNAEPTLNNNKIKFNRSGIVVQANSRPVLRGNVVENSQEDGLVIISQALPDLGNSAQAGNNQFRGNKRFDINAQAAKQLTTSYGNILKSDRIAGKVDIGSVTANTLNSSPRENTISKASTRAYRPRRNNLSILDSNINQTAPPIAPTASNDSGNNLEVGKDITFSAPSSELKTNGNQVINPINNIPKSSITSTNRPIQPRPPAQIVDIQRGNSRRRNAVDFPVPTNLTTNNRRSIRPATPQQTVSIPQVSRRRNSQTVKQFNYIKIDPDTIEFSANPSSRSNQNGGRSRPSANNNMLSVPNSPIPGKNKNTQQIFPPGNKTQFNPIAGNYGNQVLRYKVTVEVRTSRDENLVRFFAPGAFVTNNRNAKVMQAGVFSSRANAVELMRIFNNNGLNSKVERL